MSASRRLTIAVGLTAALLVAPGHAKASKDDGKPVFFPPAPDEPHIQYLTSFSSDDELADLAGKRGFFNFIVGAAKGVHPIVKPYGIVTSPGKIYTCDTVGSTVEIADLSARKMSFFSPAGNGALGLPVNMAVDTDGTRYIADTKRQQVLVYKEDNFAGAIGKGNEIKPGGVALTGNRIYVTDLQNHCVRVYDKADRKELFTFPKAGESNKAAQLYSPTSIAIDPKGRVHVSDTGGFFVNVYDAEGKYLRTIGGQGLQPGKFALPKGVAVDHEGLAYVVDATTQVVQIFDAEGRILMYFGDPTTNKGGSTSLPAGVAVDYDNVKYFQRFVAPGFNLEYLVLVANQTGIHKVSVFGFGHKK